MNKYIFKSALLILLLLGTSSLAFADKDPDRLRKKYINLSFTNSTLSLPDVPTLKSNYGAAFTAGRTFFLHKRPLAGMLHFGIDATWFDLNYVNYKIMRVGKYSSDIYSYNQGEVAMHVGPSLTVTPVTRLHIHAYFRYAPTLSVLYTDEGLYGNYATFFVGGGSVAYGAVGLGFEGRFGRCNYNELVFAGQDGLSSLPGTAFGGWRAYINFRF